MISFFLFSKKKNDGYIRERYFYALDSISFLSYEKIVWPRLWKECVSCKKEEGSSTDNHKWLVMTYLIGCWTVFSTLVDVGRFPQEAISASWHELRVKHGMDCHVFNDICEISIEIITLCLGKCLWIFCDNI